MYYFLSNREGKRDSDNKPLSQLVYFDFLVKNEIEITKILRQNPDKDELFYLIQSVERIKISTMDENTYNINDTKDIRKDNSILLKFNNKNIVHLNTYLKSQSSSKKYIFQLIEFYKYLLTTIKILISKDIVHNNICFSSTVVDFTETPLLSNFSYSLNINNNLHIHNHIRNILNEYSSEYIHRPIEFHILSYMITNKIHSLSIYNIHTIIDNIYDNHFILNQFGNNTITNFKEESRVYYKKYVNKSYEDILNDMLNYFSTWDNYSLSIMYLNILIGIHKTIQKKNKLIILFMRLLIENINPNPLKRNSIETTTNKFKMLIYNSDISEFSYLVNHL